jgi:enamine deaminase RidA (YjgF/YER057c/UK114 family)
VKAIENLLRIGIELPPCPAPAAVYAPGVITGNLLFISGQTPKEGTMLKFKGKLGRELTIEEGQAAARIAAIRAISVIQEMLGDLERVERIVKVTGYVNCTEDFGKQSQVIDGASVLFGEIFEERGIHSRVALGAHALPGNAAVEIEAVVSIKPVK